MPHRTFLPARGWLFALAIAVLFAASADAQTSISTAVTSAQTDSASSNNNVTITSTGSVTVSSNNTAVTFGASGTMDNFGTISDTSANNAGNRALNFKTGTSFTLTNEAGATISAANEDAVHVTPDAAITINNSGTIQALNTLFSANQSGTPHGQGIDLNNILTAANSIFNNSGGSIFATGEDAVRPGVNGNVTNSGTIKSTAVAGSSSDGVDGQTNTGITVTNNSGGLIEGGRHGITGGNTTGAGTYAMSITNNAGATIQGDNGSGINLDGLNANETVTIVNHGTITGNGVTGDGDGVDVDGLVNLTNTGTIKSLNAFNDTSEGVTVGGGTITNSGTIQGSIGSPSGNTGTGRGITIAGVDKDANDNPIPTQAPYAATTIHNLSGGLIKGDSDAGIAFTSALASGFSHTITNDAGATIQTGSATAAAIVTAADNVTINNAGTIDGSSSGSAIVGGTGNLTVSITGGSASVLGNITGGSGTNTLTFDLGSSSNAFTHSGVISNFSSVAILSGKVSLNGANTYPGATTLASAAILGGSGSLAGDLAASGIVAPGNSIGTFTVGGNVTWNGSAGNAWQFQLGAGNTSDLLSIGGNFLKGSGSTFAFDFLNGSSAGTFTLVNWSGTTGFTASDFSYTDLGGGLTGSFALSGGELTFTAVSAIPEPATYAAIIGAGALALGCWQRRRKSRVLGG